MLKDINWINVLFEADSVIYKMCAYVCFRNDIMYRLSCFSLVVTS